MNKLHVSSFTGKNVLVADISREYQINLNGAMCLAEIEVEIIPTEIELAYDLIRETEDILKGYRNEFSSHREFLPSEFVNFIFTLSCEIDLAGVQLNLNKLRDELLGFTVWEDDGVLLVYYTVTVYDIDNLCNAIKFSSEQLRELVSGTITEAFSGLQPCWQSSLNIE